jgi:hypothetical protein
MPVKPVKPVKPQPVITKEDSEEEGEDMEEEGEGEEEGEETVSGDEQDIETILPSGSTGDKELKIHNEFKDTPPKKKKQNLPSIKCQEEYDLVLDNNMTLKLFKTLEGNYVESTSLKRYIKMPTHLGDRKTVSKEKGKSVSIHEVFVVLLIMIFFFFSRV